MMFCWMRTYLKVSKVYQSGNYWCIFSAKRGNCLKLFVFSCSSVIRECPIFFRPHSKAILSRAIHNDTEFLAQQMVMDYSLLVGIDEARSELVIGIIGE